MNEDYGVLNSIRKMFSGESADERRILGAKATSECKFKKGKKRKNWENNNTIWQGKRR